MCQAVEDDRMDTGIGQVDLETLASRGIPVEDAVHVLPDQGPDAGPGIGCEHCFGH
jgi:hypothetical protein